MQFANSGNSCIADIGIPSLNLVIEYLTKSIFNEYLSLISRIFQGEQHGGSPSPYFGDTRRIPLLDMDKKSKFEELEYHENIVKKLLLARNIFYSKNTF